MVRNSGFIFYFSYKVFKGGETITHEIPCDMSAPATLVITEEREGVHFVSLIVGPDDKREWSTQEIVSLKFGFQL